MKRTIIVVCVMCFLLISLITFIMKPKKVDRKLNYNDNHNWASLPMISKDVDVFYVYPTVSRNNSGVMDIMNDDERELVHGIIKSQASVFESSTNVFAPFYRQMSTFVQIPINGDATNTKEFKQGVADVEDAFEYYIRNLNYNRPFIIAGHSQGTMALIELIKKQFGKNEELRNRLVAAYLIGYTVTNYDLSKSGLTAAKNATDVGVVITYNTQSVTSKGGPMLLNGAHCINPLNWRTDDAISHSSENLGAVFFNDQTGEFEREVVKYCGAQIDSETGALLTTIPVGETLDIGPYNEGVYHRYDYAFWYRNLQKNVNDRINAYLKKREAKAKH